MKLHYSTLRGKILCFLISAFIPIAATAQNFNPGIAPEIQWPPSPPLVPSNPVGSITHTSCYSGMIPLFVHAWDDPASSLSGIAWTDHAGIQGYLNYPTGVRDLEVTMMDWPGSTSGTRVIVAYYNSNTNMGVTGMGIGGSGAPLTPGHYFDEFDWNAGGLTWANTTQLSTMPTYTRISNCEHLTYAVAIAWEEPTGIHVIARETGMGWGPIVTLNGTAGETFPDVAFSHTPSTGTPGIRFVYHKCVGHIPPDENNPGGGSGARITESYIPWGSIIPPFSGTTITPTIEDLNFVPWPCGDFRTHIDAPDHNGTDDWTYSYVDPWRNKVYVRVMDYPVKFGIPVTYCLNDGTLFPTLPIDQQYGGPVTNDWPVVSYEQMGSPTGGYELYTGWHTYYDNPAGPAPFSNVSGQYVGMKITPAGAVTSMTDYINVPTNMLTPMTTPGINFSKNNEQPNLYVIYGQIDPGGNNIIQTKLQPWPNASFRPAKTPEEHAAILSEAINVYPSPFRDNLNISMPGEMTDNEMNISVTDLKGALVKTFDGKGKDANTFLKQVAGSITPGVYLVNVKAAFIHYNRTFKVEKQH